MQQSNVSARGAGRPPRSWPFLVLVVALVAFGGCGEPSDEHAAGGIDWGGDIPAPPSPDDFDFQVPPPDFKGEDIFPCSECHDEDMPADPEPRVVSQHPDIVLRHDEEHRWCLDCHDADNRDKLRLASGALVDFTESYRLCGQCHGDKYRDWRAGVHGRRVGEWNGAKEYLLCVHCHDSHQPAFQPLKPKPPPLRPEDIR